MNTIIIKSNNRRFTSGMILNGNLLTGDTYPAKDNIKKYWNGKWNAQNKAWEVDPGLVMQTLQSKNNWGLSVAEDSEPTAQPKHNHSHKVYEVCPICGTYCYGDCQTN